MDEYLERACKYLDVDVGNVINPRVEGDNYVLIVDKGIAGSPKYYIPLSKLDKPQPKKLLTANEGVALSYRELQAVAIEQGIPANQSADALRIALWPEVKLWSDEEE
jgi:hypothetical protein